MTPAPAAVERNTRNVAAVCHSEYFGCNLSVPVPFTRFPVVWPVPPLAIDLSLFRFIDYFSGPNSFQACLGEYSLSPN